MPRPADCSHLRLAILTPFVLALLIGCGPKQRPSPTGGAALSGSGPDTAEPEARDSADRQGAAADAERDFRLEVLPESEYQLIDIRQHEDPQLGYTLRYVGEQRPDVDVFIYPVAPPGAEMTDSLRARLVAEQYELSMEGIEVYAERNSWTVDRSAEPSLLEVDTRCGGMEAHHGRVTYTDREGGPEDSHLIVLGADLTFLKVRSTFPEERRQEGWEHVQALLRELAGGMLCTERG